MESSTNFTSKTPTSTFNLPLVHNPKVRLAELLTKKEIQTLECGKKYLEMMREKEEVLKKNGMKLKGGLDDNYVKNEYVKRCLILDKKVDKMIKVEK